MADLFVAQRGLALLDGENPAAALPLLKLAAKQGEATPKILLGIALATEQTLGPDHARALYRALPVLFPEWDEAALRWADFLRRTGDRAAAELAYRATLEINPNRVEALLALGSLLLAVEKSREAQILLLRACGLAPARAEAWNHLGLAFVAQRDFGIAVTAFSLAHQRNPGSYEYAMHRVEAAWRAKQFAPELALIERECALSPLDPVLATARGFLLALAGRLAEAADAFEAAVVLAPDASEPAMQWAIALLRLDRNEAAVPLLRRLYVQHPENQKLANDLAVALMRSHWHTEAAEILQHCLDHQPWSTATACNLVITKLWQGHQAEAVALARRAIAADPTATQPRRVLCNALPYAEGEDGATALAAARECAATLVRPPAAPFSQSRDPLRRLRVGLLSDLLRTHPAGWLTVAGFEALDPAQFEIFVFGRNAGDTISRRIATLATEWIAVDDLDDPALAAAIRAREIDILIDLGGWGDHGRLPVCACRPAPVQIKWVGMQNHSTGLAEIDWMISDRWETPPDLASLYSEKLLVLPDGYVCYSPPPYAPSVGPLPALAAGAVTFGCFNNLAKITDGAIRVWSDILDRLPQSRIILKTHQFSEQSSRTLIHGKFAVCGIDSSRVVLEGRSPHREFLGAYNKIDIALDPFPYTGGLGTCEALWMGVPTVTLPGDSFASRHSLSHLCNVGLSDWVAADTAAYIAIAVARAADLPALATLRGTLRARVNASPLCDAPRFGRNLGTALRLAYVRSENK